MKNIVYGIVFAVLGVLIVLVLLTVNGKMTRQAEIDDSLASAVENAVDNCLNRKNYSIEDNKEFIADLNQEILAQIENDADIEIQINKADKQKGILSIKVIEHFKNPNTKESKQEYSTTAVLDGQEKNKYYKITFEDGKGNILNVNYLASGTTIVPPKNDNISYWIDKDTNITVTEFGKVDNDRTFVPVLK